MSDSPHFNYHYCLTWVFWSTATGVKDKYKQHNEENGDKNQQGNKPCALVYRSSWSLASCSEKERRKTSDSKHSELPVVSFFLAGGGGGGKRGWTRWWASPKKQRISVDKFYGHTQQRFEEKNLYSPSQTSCDFATVQHFKRYTKTSATQANLTAK